MFSPNIKLYPYNRYKSPVFHNILPPVCAYRAKMEHMTSLLVWALPKSGKEIDVSHPNTHRAGNIWQSPPAGGNYWNQSSLPAAAESRREGRGDGIFQLLQGEPHRRSVSVITPTSYTNHLLCPPAVSILMVGACLSAKNNHPLIPCGNDTQLQSWGYHIYCTRTTDNWVVVRSIKRIIWAEFIVYGLHEV